jgi:hypothetical protein
MRYLLAMHHAIRSGLSTTGKEAVNFEQTNEDLASHAWRLVNPRYSDDQQSTTTDIESPTPFVSITLSCP